MSGGIEDYALIGDCRSAALVSRWGSIDWLCWPRFDSPSLFGALVDARRAGRWSIAAPELRPRRRRYVGESAVLETVLGDETAELVITDAMPVVTPAQAKVLLTPEHELIRTVACTRGVVTVEVELLPRPNFGQEEVSFQPRGKLGVRMETSEGLLTLRTDAPEARVEEGALRWTLKMSAGQVFHFSLAWSTDAPAVLPPLGAWTRACIERTVANWQTWAERTQYTGEDRAQVIRSAITVRLLSYAPSGAIVAAPTTSLPEEIGGSSNYDYRFCWLRDAAFTVRGLLELGHSDEAGGFASWLLHATRLTQPKLKVLYDVYGRQPSSERKLDGLRGYAGSRPVRVGNAADEQLQLDSYGEVIDAVWRITLAGHPLHRETCGVLEDFGRYVCQHWREPDAGIWEPRGPPRRHTHSVALCWTALERLIDLQARGMMRARHRALFESTRAQISSELRARAFNPRLDSYTAELDGESLDATSLLLGWYGFERASSLRMKGTFTSVMKELSPRPGLLYRNRKPGDGEGAFGVCSFWIAEHLAKGGGTLEEAKEALARTTAFANDVGLFAEEIEPTSGRALGNFPQTFTHVGHLNAALSVAARERGTSP